MKLTFEEFKDRVIQTWRTDLESMGYELPTFYNHGDSYDACFSRFDSKRNCRVWTLNLIYEGDVSYKPFEINEHFDDFENIPECYNVPRLEGMPEQAPMFIYGQYWKFGDALNSLKKGDSLNGRKYKELYY